VVVTFLIGCAFLFIVLSASAMRAEASHLNKQGHTEATNTEQGHSGGAAPEGDRCEGTRTIVRISAGYLTNDLAGCPNKGGLLSAQLPDTGKRKISSPNYGLMMGEKGDDEVRGLGGSDELYGGDGDDVIYGGSGGDFVVGSQDDDVIHTGDGGDYLVDGGKGEDVLYGGDGNDHLEAEEDGHRDKLYYGKGKDRYRADKNDHVDSRCEKKQPTKPAKGPGVIDLGGDVVLSTSSATSSASASPFSGSAKEWWSCHPSAGGRAAARVGHPDLRDP
jgi:hypothetical protein